MCGEVVESAGQGHGRGCRDRHPRPCGSVGVGGLCDDADMRRIDLHAHSSRSDGTLTPTQVVELAAERGLDVVALTDHDTTEGLAEAMAAGERSGVEVVPGVEFSAEYRGKSVHVLAHWMRIDDPAFQEELTRLRDERFRRGERMVELLHGLGVEISFDRVREISGGGNIVRPHIAQALVEAGAVATEREAFERYIADGGPAYLPKHALQPTDAVALIRSAGGVATLAHPGLWGSRDEPVPEEMIDEMAAAGLTGLEVDHIDHDADERAHYDAVASRLGLIPTGGSDCHGARHDPMRLGTSLCREEAFAALAAAAGRA